MLKFIAALMMLMVSATSAWADCTAEHPVEALVSNVDPIGQSWTAPCSGFLSSITVKADLPNAGTHTLSIYTGQSVAAGDLLAQQGGITLANGDNTINIVSDVDITDGQQYTFVLDNDLNNLIRLRYDAADGYAGGQAYNGVFFVAGADLWFKADIVTSRPDNGATAGDSGCFISTIFPD